jgi:histidine ammonia-lyase
VEPVVLDGQSLTIAGIVGVARYGASVALSDARDIRERIVKSRKVLIDKIEANKSVYGINTGLGESGTRHPIVSRSCCSTLNLMTSANSQQQQQQQQQPPTFSRHADE